MKNKLLLILSLASICMLPSIVNAEKDANKEKKKAPDPAKIIEKLDADGSGTLSIEEVAKSKGLTKRFQKLDTDEDGELSLEELTKTPGKKKKKAKGDQ